ncbi:MAG: helix-turn-helix domain-containing protein [Rhodospirillaceae bacterium]|nr:helix-turn-helix domain-containing protein [Rhodospirillaceae bacterium]
MQGQSAHHTDPTTSAVGALLCATRMRLGKDLQQVAAILHIRYNYLVAMEDGRYEDLPGQAYAIGFVRAYADHLGLDGDEIVRRYKEESSGLKNRPVFEFPVPTPDSGVPSGALILVAIILGMTVYGVWYAVAGSDRAAVQLIQEVPSRLTAAVEPPPQAVADLPADLPPASDESASAAALPESETGSQTPQPTIIADAAPIPAPAIARPTSTDVVELRAKADVWITLRTADNPDRTQLLHKDEVFRAPAGGGGMTLVTAKPGDLEILVNGQVMPPLDAGIFARGVPLDPARLKSGAAPGADASPGPDPSPNPGLSPGPAPGADFGSPPKT